MINESEPNTLVVRGTVLGQGIPRVCVPVTGSTDDCFLANVRLALMSHPDLLELRIDTLRQAKGVKEFQSVLVQALECIRGVCPVILTYRTRRDGGEGDPGQYRELIDGLLDTKPGTDLLDLEISAGQNCFEVLSAKARSYGVPVIGSWHSFTMTPSVPELRTIFKRMEDWGADIAKIAVMPACPDDVDRLIKAAGESRKALRIPLIAISMGELGRRTRLECETFGSCLTFASAGACSAPGQMSVDTVREALIRIHRQMTQ